MLPDAHRQFGRPLSFNRGQRRTRNEGLRSRVSQFLRHRDEVSASLKSSSSPPGVFAFGAFSLKGFRFVRDRTAYLPHRIPTPRKSLIAVRIYDALERLSKTGLVGKNAIDTAEEMLRRGVEAFAGGDFYKEASILHCASNSYRAGWQTYCKINPGIRRKGMDLLLVSLLLRELYVRNLRMLKYLEARGVEPLSLWATTVVSRCSFWPGRIVSLAIKSI
jgi:hypothetical protein